MVYKVVAIDVEHNMKLKSCMIDKGLLRAVFNSLKTKNKIFVILKRMTNDYLDIK